MTHDGNLDTSSNRAATREEKKHKRQIVAMSITAFGGGAGRSYRVSAKGTCLETDSSCEAGRGLEFLTSA